MHVRAPKPLSGICRSVYMFARWNINRSKVLSTDVFKILLEIRVRCDIFCPYLLILGDGGAENQVLKGGGVIVSVPRSEFCCYVSFQMSVTVCPSGRDLWSKVQNPAISIGTYSRIFTHNVADRINSIVEEYLPCFG